MPKKIQCPKCKTKFQVNIGRLLGSVKSEAKAAQSRINGSKHKAKNADPDRQD